MKILRGVYAYVGELPIGCELCMHGVKMVIFVTGLCGDRCFYCPVSSERLYHDVKYVDEEPLEEIGDAVDEAFRIGAEGASITGGDPLVVPRRTIALIRLLKEVFGDSFHVHLYTSGRYATREVLRELERAGLDEIRFHPTEPRLWSRIELAIKTLRDVKIGAEVPVLPGASEYIKKLIKFLDKIGASFINLNELEASDSNLSSLMSRGYRVSRRRPVVEGSEEEALQIVKWAEEAGIGITVHYCPASYKDSIQMRLRLVRKATRLRKPYEEVTPEGMLAYGIVDATKIKTMHIVELADTQGDTVRVPPALARKLGGTVKKRYPSLARAHKLPVEIERITQQSYDTA